MGPLLVSLILAASVQTTPFRNLDPDTAYAGDKACSACHRREASTFGGTAMGRSLSLPSSIIEGDSLPGRSTGFANALSSRRYRVFAEKGRLFQEEIFLGTGGTEISGEPLEIDYVLGSGDRGQTFLVHERNRIWQTAVAYRQHRDGWGMAAGLESLPEYGMRRPVTQPCLFCHSNRSEHVVGTLNEYADAPFEGYTIGCERCHGPGALHVQERRSLPPTESGFDTSIVNPRRLESGLRDQVCFQCHLQGSSRVLKKGRQPHDYRPGMPLSEVFAVFHEADEGNKQLKVVSHVERLRASRCWQASNGEIDCLTCHNPHKTPRGDEASDQFRAACMTCHETGCPLPEETRGSSGRSDDCVRCHMSKAPPSDAPHTLFTDHKISKHPEKIAADGKSPHRIGRLLNFLEGDAGSSRDLGMAYLLYAIAEGDRSAAARGAGLLEPVVIADPEDFRAMRLMAGYYLNNGRTREATALLESLAELIPQMAEIRVQLARLYMTADRVTDAIVLLVKATGEDPGYAPGFLSYGDALNLAGRHDEAWAQYRIAASLDPSMAAARARLGDQELRKGDTAAARKLYEKALVLNPSLESARRGLASLEGTR